MKHLGRSRSSCGCFIFWNALVMSYFFFSFLVIPGGYLESTWQASRKEKKEEELQNQPKSIDFTPCNTLGLGHYSTPSSPWWVCGLCRERDYRIRSKFWKFYLIWTGFALDESVSLMKVFRLFRLEAMFFGVESVDTAGRCTTSYLLAGPACLWCLVFIIFVGTASVVMLPCFHHLWGHNITCHAPSDDSCLLPVYALHKPLLYINPFDFVDISEVWTLFWCFLVLRVWTQPTDHYINPFDFVSGGFLFQ